MPESEAGLTRVPNEELWGPVPAGGDVVRKGVPRACNPGSTCPRRERGREEEEAVLTEYPGEPEVAQLDDLVLGDEDVLRLHVPVHAADGSGR